MPYVEGYVPPSAVSQPQQRLEQRPTFEGRSSVGRLLVFVALGLVVVVASYLWIGLDKLPSLGLGLFFALSLWATDNLFATGYLHKLLEQRTEQMRIRKDMLDMAMLNQAQDELLNQILEELQRLDQRIDSIEVISIRQGDKVTIINKTDDVDLRLRGWIQTEIFSGGVLSGIHPNGQLKRAMPWKDKGDDESVAGYRRLLAAGLVSKGAHGYMWIGPVSLLATLEKLANVRSRVGGLLPPPPTP